jgi:decaprenyl-phosphate phosphoribosyltransferase
LAEQMPIGGDSNANPQAKSPGSIRKVTSNSPGDRKRRPWFVSMLLALRPKQWIKNLLVFAAPAAAGKILDPTVDLEALLAAIFFIMVSSGLYLLNDCVDIESDRRHPKKRYRPIPSGEISIKQAQIFALLLLLAGNVAPFFLLRYQLGVVVVTYSAITASYIFYLKQEAVLDIATVALGFLLRAMAGGEAANLTLSNWFLIVASFGSLFMVSGKRYSELVVLGDEAGRHRRTLDVYSKGYLNFIRSISAGVTITAYCLWAFDKPTVVHNNALLIELSIVPFVLAVLRYSLVIEEGLAGAPEDVVLSDRPLLILGLLWAVLLIFGILIF